VRKTLGLRGTGRIYDCKREPNTLTCGALIVSAGTVFLGLLAAQSLPAAQQPEIAATVAFTEGPTVAPDGTVYFSDLLNQRIYQLRPDRVLVIYREQSNGANGLLIDAAGRLVACEGAEFARPGVVNFRAKPRVTRTDLKTGRTEVLADSGRVTPLVGPNDVTTDSKGRLYFTDFTGAAVYRIDAPGKVVRILAAPEVERPNGIQVSPDDSKLYLVEANRAEGGARLIRSYDLRPHGTVANMRVLYDFSPGRGADGLSIDTQGNLYASAGLNQPRGTAETLDTKAGVYVISPRGKLLKFIPVPEDLVTNNAFGGPDMKTLYITAGKNLYQVRTEMVGLSR
jgi:gluconolactonase